jgi:hypothetical protein
MALLRDKDTMVAANISLAYRAHFYLFSPIFFLLSYVFLYHFIVEGFVSWPGVRYPWWFQLAIMGFGYSYLLYMTTITSYVLEASGDGVTVKRPWGSKRRYPFSELVKLIRVTKSLSLVRTAQGAWIPVAGIKQAGMKKKEEFEALLRKHAPLQSSP